MHVSVSGLRAQKSTFFGPGPALDFSRNGLRSGTERVVVAAVAVAPSLARMPSASLVRHHNNMRQQLEVPTGQRGGELFAEGTPWLLLDSSSTQELSGMRGVGSGCVAWHGGPAKSLFLYRHYIF